MIGVIGGQKIGEQFTVLVNRIDWLAKESGVFVAASDYVKATAEMINRWVPGGLYPLGTDGFGRSDDRAVLRRHFEVDAECITVAVLSRLAAKK